MRKLYLFTIIVLLFPVFLSGQVNDEVKVLVDKGFQTIEKRGKGDVKPRARFYIDTYSSGHYSFDGKVFYIVYPDSEDTLKTSEQAMFIEKLICMQGASRTYIKEDADFIVYSYFERTRERRTFYKEVEPPLYSGARLGSYGIFRPETYNSAIGKTSAENPGLPYYQSSFGQAGRRKTKVRYHISDFSFSVVLEAYSQSGERLWISKATDYRRAAVTDAVLPYLCFPLIGKLGNNSESSVQFLSDNPAYMSWKEGLMLSSNTVFYPLQEASSAKVEVAFVLKDGEELIIVLKDKFNEKKLKSKDVYLEYDNYSIPATARYSEQKLRDNSYASFSFLKFPVKSRDLKGFDIVFYKGNNKKKEKYAIRNIKLAE